MNGVQSPHRNVSLFDLEPIKIGGFELRGKTAAPVTDATGRPSLAGWEAAFDFACSTEESSPYWVGDLLGYAETRDDWRAKMDQAKSSTRLAHGTLLNRSSISKRVTGRARELAPTITHASVVAALEPEEQEALLEQAQTENWTVSELTRAKKARERRVVARGHAETMHTIEVTVRLTREAPTVTQAEDLAWHAVKSAIAGVPHAHVIGAKAWVSSGPLRLSKKERQSA